jgi:hypothetical protein
MNLNDILKPNDGTKPAAQTKVISTKIDTKQKLQDLKETLLSDPIVFDPFSFNASDSDFPSTDDTAKWIDYVNDRIPAHEIFATETINGIISTYLKSDSILNSPRIKALKRFHISKYTSLLFMLENTQTNLIKLQENIDGGDMSKEMFDNVKNYQVELRANLKEIDLHLDKCDQYWENYATSYGFENQEDKIIQETEKRDESTKKTVMDMSELTERINDAMTAKSKNESDRRKEED